MEKQEKKKRERKQRQCLYNSTILKPNHKEICIYAKNGSSCAETQNTFPPANTMDYCMGTGQGAPQSKGSGPKKYFRETKKRYKMTNIDTIQKV